MIPPPERSFKREANAAHASLSTLQKVVRYAEKDDLLLYMTAAFGVLMPGLMYFFYRYVHNRYQQKKRAQKQRRKQSEKSRNATIFYCSDVPATKNIAYELAENLQYDPLVAKLGPQEMQKARHSKVSGRSELCRLSVQAGTAIWAVLFEEGPFFQTWPMVDCTCWAASDGMRSRKMAKLRVIIRNRNGLNASLNQWQRDDGQHGENPAHMGKQFIGLAKWQKQCKNGQKCDQCAQWMAWCPIDGLGFVPGAQIVKWLRSIVLRSIKNANRLKAPHLFNIGLWGSTNKRFNPCNGAVNNQGWLCTGVPKNIGENPVIWAICCQNLDGSHHKIDQGFSCIFNGIRWSCPACGCPIHQSLLFSSLIFFSHGVNDSAPFKQQIRDDINLTTQMFGGFGQVNNILTGLIRIGLIGGRGRVSNQTGHGRAKLASDTGRHDNFIQGMQFHIFVLAKDTKQEPGQCHLEEFADWLDELKYERREKNYLRETRFLIISPESNEETDQSILSFEKRLNSLGSIALGSVQIVDIKNNLQELCTQLNDLLRRFNYGEFDDPSGVMADDDSMEEYSEDEGSE